MDYADTIKIVLVLIYRKLASAVLFPFKDLWDLISQCLNWLECFSCRKFRNLPFFPSVRFHCFLFVFVSIFVLYIFSFIFLFYNLFQSFGHGIVFITFVFNMTQEVFIQNWRIQTMMIFSLPLAVDLSLHVFSIWQKMQRSMLKCWFSSSMLARRGKSFSMLVNDLLTQKCLVLKFNMLRSIFIGYHNQSVIKFCCIWVWNIFQFTWNIVPNKVYSGVKTNYR